MLLIVAGSISGLIALIAVLLVCLRSRRRSEILSRDRAQHDLQALAASRLAHDLAFTAQLEPVERRRATTTARLWFALPGGRVLPRPGAYGPRSTLAVFARPWAVGARKAGCSAPPSCNAYADSDEQPPSFRPARHGRGSRGGRSWRGEQGRGGPPNAKGYEWPGVEPGA